MTTTDLNRGQLPRSSVPPRGARPVRTRAPVVEPQLSHLARMRNEQVTALRHSATFNEYLCECGRKTCREPIALSIEEYNAIRVGTRFLIARDHCPVGARVVGEMERCQVIEWLRPS